MIHDTELGESVDSLKCREDYWEIWKDWKVR